MPHFRDAVVHPVHLRTSPPGHFFHFIKGSMNTISAAAALLLSLSPTLAYAASANSWSVSVQQGERTFAQSEPLTIKKAPFELVFEGPLEMGYAILASTRCDELQNLKTKEQIEPFMPMLGRTVEKSSRENRFLVVHKSGEIRAGSSQWQMLSEEPEYNRLSFQKYVPGKSGTAIARREIREIIMLQAGKTNTGAIAIESYFGSQMCLLVTGMPTVADLSHVEPKLLRITLE